MMLDHFDALVEKRGLLVSFRLGLKKDEELFAVAKKRVYTRPRKTRWISPSIKSDPMTIAQIPELSVVFAIAEEGSEWP